MRRSRADALLLVLLTAVLYGRTLTYGLMWDDFAALRARPWSAVLGAWTGGWEPNGVWPDFYRPLSIALYDTLFRLFGHHDVALHALTLTALVLAAWMLRQFVARETGTGTIGLVAAVLLLSHPETPSSLAAWVSQLFHLAALLSVLAAMRVWQRARSGGASDWLAVLACLTAGVLVKEDVVMIAPVLVAWQWIRARVLGDVPRPGAAIVATVLVWMGAYASIRSIALGALGGYPPPVPARAALNLFEAWLYTFGYQLTPTTKLAGVITGAGVVAVAGLAWMARHEAKPVLRLLCVYGLSLGIAVGLPLLMIVGHSRVHLMVLATSITAAAALAMVLDARRTRQLLRSRAGVVCAAIWLVAVGTANWRHTNTYAPCRPESLARDREVLTWSLIDPDTRALITGRMLACSQK